MNPANPVPSSAAGESGAMRPKREENQASGADTYITQGESTLNRAISSSTSTGISAHLNTCSRASTSASVVSSPTDTRISPLMTECVGLTRPGLETGLRTACRGSTNCSIGVEHTCYPLVRRRSNFVFEGAANGALFDPVRSDVTTETTMLPEVPQDTIESTTDWYALFYRRANRYELLTKEKEVELAKAIERGDLEA